MREIRELRRSVLQLSSDNRRNTIGPYSHLSPIAEDSAFHSLRLLQDTTAASTSLLQGNSLIQALNSRQVYLKEVCEDVTDDFKCHISDLTAEHSTDHAFLFTVPESSDDTERYLDVSLSSLSGNSDLLVYKVPSDSNPVLLLDSDLPEGIDRVFLDSADMPAGTVIEIIVSMKSPLVMYTLSVELLAGGRKLVATELSALRQIVNSCCPAGSCQQEWEDVRAEAAAPAQQGANSVVEKEICHIAPNHCNEDGQLVELAFETSGFACDVSALAPLHKLEALSVLVIDDGASDTHRGQQLNGTFADLFTALDDVPSLEHLTVRNTIVRGELPAECADSAALKRLKSFHLRSATNAAGELPPCLISNAHALDLHDVGLSGTMPPLPSGSSIKLIRYSQKNSAPLTMEARDLDLSAAANLTTIEFSYVGLSGSVILPASLEALHILDVPLSSIIADSAELPNLHFVVINGTSAAGVVPRFLVEGDKLQSVSLLRNAFSSLPSDWTSPNLEYLDLSSNRIGGTIPTEVVKQPQLAKLDLSGNRFSGQTTDLKTALAQLLPTISTITYFSIANNNITGTLNGLELLGVFKREPAIRIDGRRVNVFDAADNKFVGQVPPDFYTLDESLLLPNYKIEINVNGNLELECPTTRQLSNPVFIVECDENAEGASTTFHDSPIPNDREISAGDDDDDLNTGGILALAAASFTCLIFAAIAAMWLVRRRQQGESAAAGGLGGSVGMDEAGSLRQRYERGSLRAQYTDNGDDDSNDFGAGVHVAAMDSAASMLSEQ